MIIPSPTPYRALEQELENLRRRVDSLEMENAALSERLGRLENRDYASSEELRQLDYRVDDLERRVER